MDEAIARPDAAVGICSAATKAGFEKVVNSVVGKAHWTNWTFSWPATADEEEAGPVDLQLSERKSRFTGGHVAVIEDSIVGLRAAEGAGMPCIITRAAALSGRILKAKARKFAATQPSRKAESRYPRFFREIARSRVLTFNITTTTMIVSLAGAVVVIDERLVLCVCHRKKKGVSRLDDDDDVE